MSGKAALGASACCQGALYLVLQPDLLCLSKPWCGLWGQGSFTTALESLGSLPNDQPWVDGRQCMSRGCRLEDEQRTWWQDSSHQDSVHWPSEQTKVVCGGSRARKCFA